MFGQYHHILTVHAPQQFRIVTLSSTNAENEERAFNFLKSISTQTSNYHPENVIANAFMRSQVSNEVFILLISIVYEAIIKKTVFKFSNCIQ